MGKSNDDGLYGFLLGALIGAAAGAAYGLLYAPKSGKAFRKEVKDLVSRIPEIVEEELEPNSQTRKIIDRTRINIEESVENMGRRRQASRLAQAKDLEQQASGIDYN